MSNTTTFPGSRASFSNCHLEGVAIIPVSRFQELLQIEKFFNSKNQEDEKAKINNQYLK